MTLTQKTAKNIGIIFLATIFNRVVRFISKIILARLLLPADFGLVALGSLAIETLNLFRDVGMGSALIYQKKQVKEAANTAFILIPIIAVILFITAYFIAPFVAAFFGELAVTEIVRILAIVLIIGSLGSVPATLLEKELNFKKAVIPQIASTIVYAIVAISLALNGFGFWSLVYGALASSFGNLITIWCVSPWRPEFRFNKQAAMELVGYGKHILGVGILVFLATNLDDAIVGKILGMSALGMYTIAYSISNLPATNITHLINRVMFPTYSALQDDKERLKIAYVKTLKYVSLLSIPLAFGIIAIAHDFVYVILTEKWIPTIALIQILCFYGLVRAIGAATGDIFKAIGKPRLLTFFTAIPLIIFIIFVIPVIEYYGLVGICILVTISEAVSVTFAFMKVNRILEISLVEFSNIIKNPFLAGSLSLIFTVFTRSLTSPVSA